MRHKLILFCFRHVVNVSKRISIFESGMAFFVFSLGIDHMYKLRIWLGCNPKLLSIYLFNFSSFSFSSFWYIMPTFFICEQYILILLICKVVMISLCTSIIRSEVIWISVWKLLMLFTHLLREHQNCPSTVGWHVAFHLQYYCSEYFTHIKSLLLNSSFEHWKETAPREIWVTHTFSICTSFLLNV